VATASAPQAEIRTTPQPKLAISRTIPQNILQLWHLTSLDAPTVAVTWTLAFAWAAKIHLPLWLPTTLALAAWTFYIADRLMDAKTANQSQAFRLLPVSCSLRPRHHYHWQHRRIFLPIAILSAIAGAALVLHYMPFPARERNSILAAATLVYFTTVHTSPIKPRPKSKLKLPKELLVGILFTSACVLPVLPRIPADLRSSLAPTLTVATLVYIALAWLNCHAIESWESQPTRIQGQGSIAKLSLTLAAIAAAAAAATAPHPRISFLLLSAALSAILLAWLDRARTTLNPTTLRAAADLALLTPLVLIASSLLIHF
jgi:hypothetical protein